MALSNLRKTRAGVERGTVRIKCFVQEHTDSARSRIRISRLGVQRTNNEATASMVTYLWHERWIPIGEQIYPLKSLGSLWALRRLPVETVSIWESIVPGQICWKKNAKCTINWMVSLSYLYFQILHHRPNSTWRYLFLKYILTWHTESSVQVFFLSSIKSTPLSYFKIPFLWFQENLHITILLIESSQAVSSPIHHRPRPRRTMIKKT